MTAARSAAGKLGHEISEPQLLQYWTTTQEHAMRSDYEGLPAGGNVEQAITMAQLRILRRLERQRQSR